MVFLGYRLKRATLRAGHEWTEHHLPPSVRQICSVADCIAEPPTGWLDRWDFNRASCYATAEAARAGDSTGAIYELFAYWLLGFTTDANGQRAEVSADELFDPRLPSLPDAQPETITVLGFDVVGHESGVFLPWASHSPLSCNGMAQEQGINVNQWCLLDSEAEALKFAARCNLEQPEPGRYLVVKVARGPKGKALPRRRA